MTAAASAPPAQPGAASPFAAAQQAVDHVRRLLRPFRFEVWLTLGFAAFLDQCGRGTSGGTGGSPPPLPASNWRGMPSLPDLPRELPAELPLLLLAAALVLVVAVAFVALVLWIGSRGIFVYLDCVTGGVYLDCVTSGRPEIGRPWRRHAALADSLFAWRFALACVTLAVVLLIVGLGALAVHSAAYGRIASGIGLGLALGVLLPLLALAVLAATLASVALRDFVAPLQLRHRCSCGEAVELLRPLLEARPGAFAIYALLKLAFSVAASLVAFVAGCVTCCLGFLPIVGQTLLQPLYLFERAWSLALLRELTGDDAFLPQVRTASAVPGDAGPVRAV
ncbi:MAG: hypothetical protein AB7O37_07910 [Vicinamibacteria bacterium]